MTQHQLASVALLGTISVKPCLSACMSGLGAAFALRCLAGQVRSSMQAWRRLALDQPVLLKPTAARSLVSYGSDGFHWTAPKIVLSIFLFLVAGLAEIGGGWLVWQAVRGRAHIEGKFWWNDKRAVMYAVSGSLSLVSYGFIPTAQPPPTFGRLYAVYGGFFVVLSFLWGWVVDKDKPDKGMSTVLSFCQLKERTISDAPMVCL